MAPPQSWPEFKLKKNYPGHCVFNIILANEYFNQRNFKFFISGGLCEKRVEGHPIHATPMGDTR